MKQQLRIMLLILAMIAGGASAMAQVEFGDTYVDDNGEVQTISEYTVITNEVELCNLDPGWYVVTEHIECTDLCIEVNDFSGDENGDVHIIIQNGVTMDITDNGINITNEHGNVYFHAESNTGTPGTLTAINSLSGRAISANCDITFNGLNVEAESTMDYEGIFSDGNITVNSGSITAIGENFGIFCGGYFTMNGGTVDARGNYYGIFAQEGVFFNGGKLTANGTEGAGIDGNVTLKWTSPDDSFTASGISDITTVTIPVGYAFTDGTVIYQSGSYSRANFPNGKTLTPVYKISVTSLNSSGDEVTEFYNTLTDAFNAAKSAYVPGNGSDVAEFIPTVTLHDNIDTEGNVYTIGDGSTTKKMTLDLNGHDLSGNGEGCLFTVYNNAVLSVVDNSGEDVEKGTVSYNNETAQAAIKVEIGGTLKTKSVSFACEYSDAIYNAGTAEIDGGTLTGLNGIYCKGSTTVTRTTISVEYFGIYALGDDLTIGSGVSISGYEGNGIYNSEGMLTFKAIPALTKAADATCPDIFMESGSEITFAEGSFTAPLTPMTLRKLDSYFEDVDPTYGPVTIANGYEDYVNEGNGVIAPSRVFSWYQDSDDYGFGLDGGGNVIMGAASASVSASLVGGGELTAKCISIDEAFSAARQVYAAADDAISQAKQEDPDVALNIDDYIPTVRLLSDIDHSEGTITLASSGESVFVTLDLNGHTLSGDDNELIYVDGFYGLTIDDSAGDGRIVNTGTSAILNEGNVEVKGGTFAGANYCINNCGSLDVSGGTFVMGDNADGILNQRWLTFTDLPRFVHSSDRCFSDIRLLQDTYITFGEGTYVVPERPITILIYNNEPYTFTEGYSTFVKSGENVIDPADIFIPYNVHEGLRVCMDVQSAEALIEGASAAAVTLNDDADNSSSIVRNKFANVTLSGRTLALDGTWNTLCLPFDVYDFEAMDYDDNYLFPLVNATVKELDIDGTYDENGDPAVDGPYKTGLDTQTGELRLYFREVRRIEAGKPYIVKWDTGADAYLTDPEFRNVILKDDIKPMTFPGGTFVGQFSPFEIVNDAVDFSTTQGNINEILFLASSTGSTSTVLGYSATAPRTLRSCRAHFYIPAGQLAGNNARAVSSVLLDFGDGNDATGVVELKNSRIEELKSDDGWYSMDGRKLSGEPKAKGVYIHQGRKIVVK